MALVVEPGMRPTASGKPEPVGVPYGSRARLIMIYLQSEAGTNAIQRDSLGSGVYENGSRKWAFLSAERA